MISRSNCLYLLSFLTCFVATSSEAGVCFVTGGDCGQKIATREKIVSTCEGMFKNPKQYGSKAACENSSEFNSNTKKCVTSGNIVSGIVCWKVYTKTCSDYSSTTGSNPVTYYNSENECNQGLSATSDKMCKKEDATSNVGNLTTCYKRVTKECSNYDEAYYKTKPSCKSGIPDDKTCTQVPKASVNNLECYQRETLKCDTANGFALGSCPDNYVCETKAPSNDSTKTTACYKKKTCAGIGNYLYIESNRVKENNYAVFKWASHDKIGSDGTCYKVNGCEDSYYTSNADSTIFNYTTYEHAKYGSGTQNCYAVTGCKAGYYVYSDFISDHERNAFNKTDNTKNKTDGNTLHCYGITGCATNRYTLDDAEKAMFNHVEYKKNKVDKTTEVRCARIVGCNTGYHTSLTDDEKNVFVYNTKTKNKTDGSPQECYGVTGCNESANYFSLTTNEKKVFEYTSYTIKKTNNKDLECDRISGCLSPYVARKSRYFTYDSGTTRGDKTCYAATGCASAYAPSGSASDLVKSTKDANGNDINCYNKPACSGYDLLTKAERDAKVADGNWYTCSESTEHSGCYSCKLNKCLDYVTTNYTTSEYVGSYNTSAKRYYINEDEAADNNYAGVLHKQTNSGPSYAPIAKEFTHPTTGEVIKCYYSCKRGDYVAQSSQGCFTTPPTGGSNGFWEGKIYKDDTSGKKYYAVYRKNSVAATTKISGCDGSTPVVCSGYDCDGEWQLPSPQQLVDFANWFGSASTAERGQMTVDENDHDYNLRENFVTYIQPSSSGGGYQLYGMNPTTCTSCTISNFVLNTNSSAVNSSTHQMVCDDRFSVYYRKIKIIDYSYYTR